MEKLLFSLNIYKNAIFTINIGWGGNTIISGISGKCINLNWQNILYDKLLCDSINIHTSNIEEFYRQLKLYC